MTACPLLRARLRARAALLLLATGLALACGGPPGPDAAWPPGALLSARGDGLRALLAQLESLHGTPLAHAARDLRARLPDCPELEAAAARAADWPASLRCAGDELASLRAWRGDAIAALALPVRDDAPRALLRVLRDGDGIRLELRVHPPSGGLATLLPGERAAGPSLLDERERLLHVRVRVEGALDLAGLVPEQSQADQLLHLKSRALGAALLDGTWEAALYAPRADGGMPRVALALGVRSRSAASAAAEQLVAEVARHWSVHASPIEGAPYSGACLLDLRVLPELAPCYALAGDALVFAWNPASLQHALAGEQLAREATDTRDAAGRLELDLAGLRRADLRLARRLGPESVAAVTPWPWSRVIARGDRLDDGALSLDVALLAGGTGTDARP